MSILNFSYSVDNNLLGIDLETFKKGEVNLFLDPQLFAVKMFMIKYKDKVHFINIYDEARNTFKEIVENQDIFKISANLEKKVSKGYYGNEIKTCWLYIKCEIDFTKRGVINKLNNLTSLLNKFDSELNYNFNLKYQDFLTPITHHQISPKLPFELFPYQRNTLYQMNELTKGNFDAIISNKVGENIYFNKFTKKFSKKEETISYIIKGGIIADEMGLGKTITSIAFSQTQDEQDAKIDLTNKNYPFQSKAHLIIVPSHLGKQWVSEIKKCFPDKLCYTIFTKNDHLKVTTEDVMKADYVIISYQFLSNMNYYPRYLHRYVTPSTFKLSSKILELRCYDFKKLHHEPPLFEMIKWNQIFVDEGHEVMEKNFSSNVISEIILSYLDTFKGKNYWYISGTPYNSYQGLTNILNFLKLKIKVNILGINNEKYSYEKEFNAQNNMYKNIYYYPDFMNKIMLRHSKEQVENQINLKGIKKMIHWLKQTDMEKALYDACKKNKHREYLLQLCCHLLVADTSSSMTMLTVSLEDVKENLITNHKNIVESYSSKLTKLNPLSQEYHMLKKNYQDKINQSKFILQTLNNLDKEKEDDDNECPICIDTIDDPAILSCGHVFCYECITSFTTNDKKCPLCKASIENKIVKVESHKTKKEAKDELEEKYGAKTGYLIKLVRKLLLNKENKVIIFSQYDFMLKLVSDSLSSNGVSNSFVKGNVHQRTKAIDKFKGVRLGDDENRVIMLSLKNAASGTHLVEANNIIFIEPVDKPKKVVEDIENQAIARAFRIGQKNEVTVHRLFVKDTLEEEIFEKIYKDETV